MILDRVRRWWDQRSKSESSKEEEGTNVRANRAQRRSVGFRGRLYTLTTPEYPRYVRRHINEAAHPKTRRGRRARARVARLLLKRGGL